MSSPRRTPSTTTPKCSSSVYDRLYSKSTESSRRLRKSAGKEDENTNIGVSISKKNISGSSSKKNLPKSRHKTVVKSSQKNARSTRTGTRATSTSAASSEVYNRLYSKGTASYNSKRKTASTSDTIVTKKVTKKIPFKSTTNNKRTKAT
jgi:hypothetical protein